MREELKVLCKIDHPYIVNYIQSFEDEKYIYLVMQLCDGIDMYKYMDKHGKFSEAEAAHFAKKILEALNHIHSIGVVHRDIKPDNIMIGEHKELKIIDFGLSKDTELHPRQLKSIAGSKIFMAPEVIERDSTHSTPVDLWSLGITLYVMLSGSYPFDLKNLDHEIVNTPVIFLPGDWADISWHAKGLIQGLLEKN